MALKGEIKKEGKDEVFIAKFTNGTFDQLEELAAFLEEKEFKLPSEPESDRLEEVLRVGIGWLQRLKEGR